MKYMVDPLFERDIERCEAWGVDPSFLFEGRKMKQPTPDDYWMDEPGDDSWLYSGYWDMCVLIHKGSAWFWG